MTEIMNQEMLGGLPQNNNIGPNDTIEAGERFLLLRKDDVSGISGTGIVAEGIRFHDGQCVLSWFGEYHSLEVHPSITQIEFIHGHFGLSTIKWIDRKE